MQSRPLDRPGFLQRDDAIEQVAIRVWFREHVIDPKRASLANVFWPGKIDDCKHGRACKCRAHAVYGHSIADLLGRGIPQERANAFALTIEQRLPSKVAWAGRRHFITGQSARVGQRHRVCSAVGTDHNLARGFWKGKRRFGEHSLFRGGCGRGRPARPATCRALD